MTQTSDTKARIQYSSRDELDVAVIGYCRGRSRHDLHARMRSALNGCYGPFAMAAVQAPQDKIRRQAVRSIQHSPRATAGSGKTSMRARAQDEVKLSLGIVHKTERREVSSTPPTDRD